MFIHCESTKSANKVKLLEFIFYPHEYLDVPTWSVREKIYDKGPYPLTFHSRVDGNHFSAVGAFYDILLND